MRNIEQELKLALTEREYNIFLNLSDVQPQLQTNYYFAYQGMPRNTMLRIRKKGFQYLLCYKNRLSENNGVSVCDEIECEIDVSRARLMLQNGVTPSDMNKLLGVAAAENFNYIGQLDTYRSKFRLDEWTLELDKNEYLGIVDYELECESRDVESLAKLKDYLFYNFGITGTPSERKIQRFYLARNKGE